MGISIGEMVYLGVTAQWKYTLKELMNRVRGGLPLGATRLAHTDFADFPFVPSREFQPRMALGQRALPLLQSGAESAPPLTGPRLAEAMRSAPMGPEAYQKFVERLSERGLGRSWLGVTGEPPRPVNFMTWYGAPETGEAGVSALAETAEGAAAQAR